MSRQFVSALWHDMLFSIVFSSPSQLLLALAFAFVLHSCFLFIAYFYIAITLKLNNIV